MPVTIEQAAPFFAYARDRERIRMARAEGKPRPWTDDPILNTYRFCNVNREDDVTTQWFKKHVRQPLFSHPDVLLATVLFRWFNRITTGEILFNQKDFIEGATPWDLRDRQWPHAWTDFMKQAIMKHDPPYVTGAYIIKTPDGMDKVTGVLWCVEQFMRKKAPSPGHGGKLFTEIEMADYAFANQGILKVEDVWKWLVQFEYMGHFMAYEVVTDLMHTAILSEAPDRMTWANAGPGAVRGLNRIHGRKLNFSQLKPHWNREMQELLALSDNPSLWPKAKTKKEPQWFKWDMRTVEHTLCEFDKYERVRLGEGKPRGVYR